jgi:predicted ester cyclase
MADNGQLLRRWFEEVWNQDKASVIDELMAADCVAHGLVGEDGNELTGAAAFKQFHRKFLTDFPGLRIDVADVLVDGDRTAARCVASGRHGASGKPISFTGVAIVRWQGGKAVEAWNNFDFDVMRQQIA